MSKIHPNSPFGNAFASLDCSDLRTDLLKSQQATKRREAQLAKGNTGTIHGLSSKSDAEIAKRGRMLKSSGLG